MDGEKNKCMGARKVKPKWTLESRVIKAALSYFGHVVRKERGMENDVMPESEWNGEELPRLSPGVGHDSTAQGDKVYIICKFHCLSRVICNICDARARIFI